jgi:hypothetical protein
VRPGGIINDFTVGIKAPQRSPCPGAATFCRTIAMIQRLGFS